jgi:cell division septation protein DedD
MGIAPAAVVRAREEFLMSARYSETSADTLRIDPDEDPRAAGPDSKGVRLWAALAVAAIAVAGFGGVVAYGYLVYADRGGLTPAPLVMADPKPAKVRPENPGGLRVPHQDKDVFGLGGKDGATTPRPLVETLLPLPETPLPRPTPSATPIQPVGAAAPTAVSATPSPAATVTAATAAPVQIPATPSAVAAAGRGSEIPVNPSAAPLVAPLPPPPAPSLRAAVPSGSSAGARPLADPLPALAAAPAAGAPSGRFRVQVGAMRTEAEAREAWEKVRRKHPDVVRSLGASYQRVQVPGKGDFIRVQAGPLPDAAAARDICARLSRGGTECMVVPPS